MTWSDTEKKNIRKLIDTARVTKDMSWYKKVILPKLINNQAFYKAAANATGIPAVMIMLMHIRESSSDLGKFLTYLGNGQPFNKKTTIVPKGRGPWSSWINAAVDAIQLKKLDAIKDWTLERMLYELEGFNGYGYRGKGINSPYVWSGTNHYMKGKYVADGKYDANAVDGQVGVYTYFQMIVSADKNLDFREVEVQKPVVEDVKPSGAVHHFAEFWKALLEWIFGPSDK